MSGSDTESGDLDGLKIREARTLILGSAALRDRISSCFPLDMTQIPHYANNFSDCYDVARCRNRDLGHLWQDITEHMRNGVHPWALYDDDDVFDGYRVCSGCKNVLKGYVRFYMEQTWPLLPQLFKLVRFAPIYNGRIEDLSISGRLRRETGLAARLVLLECGFQSMLV